MSEEMKNRIRELQSELPGLNLTPKEIDDLAHQLELMTEMLKKVDEIDVRGWEPAVIFSRRVKALIRPTYP